MAETHFVDITVGKGFYGSAQKIGEVELWNFNI